MATIQDARRLALALPEAEEKSHFEKADFRVNKKIFAVLHEKTRRVVVKLTANDQSVFCAFDKEVVYPVPGGWGRSGWTFVNLRKVRMSMLRDLLTTAWKSVAPVKLVNQHFPKEED